MIQVAAEPLLAPVFADLVDEEGNEAYKRSLGAYGLRGGKYEWSQLQEVVRERGELLLGYMGYDKSFTSAPVSCNCFV